MAERSRTSFGVDDGEEEIVMLTRMAPRKPDAVVPAVKTDWYQVIILRLSTDGESSSLAFGCFASGIVRQGRRARCCYLTHSYRALLFSLICRNTYCLRLVVGSEIIGVNDRLLLLVY